MNYNYDETNPLLALFVGTGIVGLLITLGSIAIAFVISAFFTALWVRLILVFMRKALDREYGRMRAAGLGFDPRGASTQISPMSRQAPPPLRDERGPRDW